MQVSLWTRAHFPAPTFASIKNVIRFIFKFIHLQLIKGLLNLTIDQFQTIWFCAKWLQSSLTMIRAHDFKDKLTDYKKLSIQDCLQKYSKI